MKIELVSPSSLRLHPYLEQVPGPDPELIVSMQTDIEERGIDQPLIVDEKNRIMDGRLRWRLASVLELEEVPVRRASSADAATIIVQSLLQRRHYTKSALAYLAYPFFEKMLDESRERMVSHRFVSASGCGSPQNRLPAVKTAEEIARGIQISRALFFQARDVHRIFAKQPKIKEQLEPQILSGELSLGYAINGAAGITSTRGKSRNQAEQLDLFHRGINALRVRFSRWDLLAEKHRQLVANEFAQAVADAPGEVQQRVLATLKKRGAVK